jgi:hypothetical protein
MHAQFLGAPQKGLEKKLFNHLVNGNHAVADLK